jgi:hypothetical protein
MPWRPHGKARVNASNPEAFGVCDRCGTLYNRRDLRYQTVRNGNQLQTTRLLSAAPASTSPRPPQTPVIQPDGLPIQNARPEPLRAPYPDGEG